MRSPLRSSCLKGLGAFVTTGAAALCLSGCGGGSDSDSDTAVDAAPPPAQASSDQTVPASAGASTSAFLSFEQGMKQTDTADPLQLSSFLPPLDDHAEPMPIG